VRFSVRLIGGVHQYIYCSTKCVISSLRQLTGKLMSFYEASLNTVCYWVLFVKWQCYCIRLQQINNLGKVRLFLLSDPLQPSGHYMYHQFNVQQFYVLLTQYIYVFCVDLRTNSDYFPIQH
jgi:hypothetical protein